ncbi:MAG: hypothetical protein E7286_07510 [Lachnospiraceae bacterium]|nr:hypothetical protein [Lachnospiraceae bacterium]
MNEIINALRNMHVPIDCDLFWEKLEKEKEASVCGILNALAPYISEINKKAPDIGATIVISAKMSFYYLFLNRNRNEDSIRSTLLEVYVTLIANAGKMSECVRFAAELYMQLDNDKERKQIIEAIIKADIGIDVISVIRYEEWPRIDYTNSYFFLCMLYHFRDSSGVLHEFRQDFYEALERLENILGLCSIMEDPILRDLIGTYTKMYPLFFSLSDENY